MLNPLVSVNDAARLLGVSKSTVFSWATSGKLPSVRFCRRLLFQESTIQQFIEDALTDVHVREGANSEGERP